MRINKRTIIKVIAGIMAAYVIYAFIFGALIFRFNHVQIDDNKEFLEGEVEVRSQEDRVILVEDRQDAALARINLIENAESTIDITSFTTIAGEARSIFFSSVVDAADRGVRVRIMLDGIFHSINGEDKDIFYAFSTHPNIEMKLYEPFDWKRPWTWNNRLHDKLIMIDEEYAMIGGRNIGDRYYAPAGFEGATNDRDVIVLNSGAHIEKTVIYDMKKYFQKLWEHDFSENIYRPKTNRQEEKGQERLAHLRDVFKEQEEKYSDFFNQDIDWYKHSVQIDGIYFVHNPLERLNKRPVVWKEMARLMEEAEESIFIQSPYVIPTEEMLQIITKNNITAEKIIILTNSLAASPNVIAYSGYISHREKVADAGIHLYEFQSSIESLHAKSFIFDGKISAVGSFNLDARSAYLNTESMVVIKSEEFAELLREELEEVVYDESLQVASDGSYFSTLHGEKVELSRTKEYLARMLSYITRFFQYLL